MPTVTFDPARRSGEPTINGTRIPVEILGAFVWSGASAAETAEDYHLTRGDVLVACRFLGTFGVDGRTKRGVTGRRWRGRWEEWAREHHGSMWSGDFDAVPDPPCLMRGWPDTTKRPHSPHEETSGGVRVPGVSGVSAGPRLAGTMPSRRPNTGR